MALEDDLKIVEHFVVTFFQKHNDERLFYHNLNHTRAVVSHSDEIAVFHDLNTAGRFIIGVAAWFHDTGYLLVGPHKHEQESVKIMRDFSRNKFFSLVVLEGIESCIMITNRLTTPVSLAQRIICDADTYHFGTAEFRHTDPLIKKELELLTGSASATWTQDSIKMLESHQFYTSYCQDRLSEGKKENLQWLKSRL